jgi:class 3 adenylate cyclase/Tfp pilus assembly protein PilF
MSRIIFILSLLISALVVQAQTNLDSLYTVWQDPSQADSLRLQAYISYIQKGFLYSQPDTTFIMADDLLAFGNKKNYPKANALALVLKGMSCKLRGDYAKALGYYNQSLKINEEVGDQSVIAKTLNQIGIIYKSQGDYSKALDCYTQSLKIKEQIGNQRGIAPTLNNIGIIYKYQGDYAKALDYYSQSLKINEQLGYQNGISFSLNNIGVVYEKQGDYAKALDYYSKSLKIKEQIGDEGGIADLLVNIGEAYFDKGDYDKALDYYNQSLKINAEVGNQSTIVNALNGIGEVYFHQGNYPKALVFCEKGYQLALSIGRLVAQKGSCKFLYQTYKALGNSNKALVYNELLNAIEDSLDTEETGKKLQQMEFSKQVYADSIANAEEARLIQEAHKEEVRQGEKIRNLGFGVGFIFLLVAGGFYSRWRYVRKSKADLQVEKDRSENLLLNILPADIAEELKEKGRADARDFEMVSILFTDFIGFTAASEKLSAQELVVEINTCFEAFDGIMDKYNIEKIKTIGDAYMAAGGLPVPTDDSVKNTVLAALEMQAFISDRKAKLDAEGKTGFEMRVGVHTGPIVAGIVGVKKFQYDIWGDTVNTASRMESSGEVGKVNISEATYELLKDDYQFSFENRGKIEAKGKGEIGMYFVSKN